LEEAFVAHIDGTIEIGRKRPHRFLVGFEEESRFAAEILKNRAFGETELRREIFDARSVVTLFGEMAHSCIDDARPLGFQTRTGLRTKTHGRLDHRPAGSDSLV